MKNFHEKREDKDSWREKNLLWGVPSFWIERFPLYYGRSKGFFRKRGISLEIKYYWGGPELAQAVRAGELAIGEMGLPPFTKAFSDGLPARVIGSSIVQQLDHYLAAKPGIKNIKELKGRRVGILSRGSCDEYFLRYMLESHSLDLDRDIEIVPLGSSYGNLDCFSSGIVDAGFIIEPYLSLGESLGVVKVVATVKDYYPRYQWGIIFARDDLLENNPELVGRAMEVYRESCSYIRENPEKAASFGAQVFGIKKEVFLSCLKRNMPSWEMNAMLDCEGVKNCIRMQKETGAVPVDFDFGAIAHQL